MGINERSPEAKEGARSQGTEEPVPVPRRGRRPRTQVEPRQMVALRMSMEGKSRKEIARYLNVDEKTVGRWLQEPAVQRELALQLASASAEISAWMVSVTSEVVATFRQLLGSDDERIRAKVCLWFLDRMITLGSQLEGDARILAPLPSSLSGLLGVAPDPDGGEVA